MSTRQRIVFLDVDGTLLDHSQRLSPAVPDAIRAARANGHLMFVCTGRARQEIPASIHDIGFDGVISAGGGFAEYGERMLVDRTMPAEAAQELVAFFNGHGIEYNLQAYADVYPSRGLFARVRPMFEAARAAGATRDMAVLEQRMAYRGPAPLDAIAKATFFGTDRSTFQTVREGLGEHFHVITGTIPYLGEAGGEVSLRGVNKGTAITAVAGALGIPLADTIGIGDSYNDLEMLQTCGVGIAMGNADETVRSYADEVTASVHEDGVAVALARHGLYPVG